MNRTQIITIIVLVLLAAFAVGWVLKGENGSEATPSPTPTVTATPVPTPTPTPKPVLHTVHLTVAGPVPDALTINAGDTVFFLNDAPAQYWIVSGTCAGFDSRRGLNQGEGYTLRFTVAETCTYANQLNTYNPAMTGTVTVR